MSLQELMDMQSEAARMERQNYHLTLGQLIEVLESVSYESSLQVVDIRGNDIDVYPSNPHSYRGFYEDLAFEPSTKPRPAGALLEDAKRAIDNEFTGYKGGEFLMDEYTSLWIAKDGVTGDALIDAYTIEDCVVVLVTRSIDRG